MLHIIRVILQQGLEAGMVAEGIPGYGFPIQRSDPSRPPSYPIFLLSSYHLPQTEGLSPTPAV